MPYSLVSFNKDFLDKTPEIGQLVGKEALEFLKTKQKYYFITTISKIVENGNAVYHVLHQFAGFKSSADPIIQENVFYLDDKAGASSYASFYRTMFNPHELSILEYDDSELNHCDNTLFNWINENKKKYNAETGP